MKPNRRTNTIVLWLVSLGLLAGMVITFTPSLGVGGGGNPQGPVAIRVNGEEIRELRVSQLRSNPLFLAVREGEVGADLELLLADTLIRQELVRQEAARERVSNADVARAVDEFRAQRGVAGRNNDRAYLDLLARSGFSDETFRAYQREELQRTRWEEKLVGSDAITEAEVQAYFAGNRERYLSEERIVARHIETATREEAEAARARIVAGEDAGLVAAEVSLARQDRNGALGAGAGETTPRPVGRPALPTPVAAVAFALAAAGVTDVVEAGERFHVVVVEEYLPSAPRPFEEVAAAVREDADAAKRAGVLERAVDRLVATARIEVPLGSSLTYQDSVVAQVGARDIRASDLVRATYTNPQIQQALSPQNAFLITAFFKPSILDQLVDQEVAHLGAASLGVPFVGTRAAVGASALNYVVRDVVASPEAIEAYYRQNLASFTDSASAQVLEVSAGSLDAAASFRMGLFADTVVDPVAVAERYAVAIEDLGTVFPGQLSGLLDVTLFGTDAFEAIPGSRFQVSDVLLLTDGATALPEAVDVAQEPEPAAFSFDQGERYVLLLADRRAARVRPLDEVRSQISATVLAEERDAVRSAWLEGIRAATTVEVFLDTDSIFGGSGNAVVGEPSVTFEFEDAPAEETAPRE
jgi:parvulin-like peptidyl-prolyl isomerase